jgi:ProP effector
MKNQTRAMVGRGPVEASLNSESTRENIANPPATQQPQRPKRRYSPFCVAAVDTLLTLRQQFPQAFARLSDRHRRPLKIGIHLDIAAAAPDLNPIEISRALRFYVSDVRYHRGCTEGVERIDLDGNPAGAVTAAQAENSKRSVAGIEAKLAQRRERRAATSAEPAPPEKPKRLTLADLKAAVAQRKLQGA